MSAIDARALAAVDWVSALAPGTPVGALTAASADASFRRYFRLNRPTETALILMDAPPPQEAVAPFVHLAKALRQLGVHTPHIHAVCEQRGFVLMEDLGSVWLLERLQTAPDQAATLVWLRRAFGALMPLQANGQALAQTLARYDAAVLLREMRLMPEWFLGRHLKLELTASEQTLIETTLACICAHTVNQPQGLVHRDFHSRNLMVLPNGELGVIDFQDALHGPLSYDWVSLLKDCYIRWPRAWVADWVAGFLDQWQQAGLLQEFTSAQWLAAIDWMGLQRHLKVLGIFARLNYRDGKAGYLADLPRVLAYVNEVLALYPELAAFRAWWCERVVSAFAAKLR